MSGGRRVDGVTGVRDMTSMTSGWQPGRDALPVDEEAAERIAWLRTVAAQVVCVGILVVSNLVAVGIDRFHWWANFILVPGALVAAAGLGLRHVNRATRFLIGWLGAIVFTTGLLLLTGSMGALWPFMIIVPCLGPVALFALRPADPSVRAMVDTVAGLGALGVVLGMMFLALDSGLVDPDGGRWWVWFMLAAGSVPLANGLGLLARRRGGYWFSTAVLLLAMGGFTILAALQEYGR
jgi:hypothetical protein